MNVFHEGAIILVLQIICTISALVIYDWIAGLVSSRKAESSAAVSLQVQISIYDVLLYIFQQ